MPLTRAQLQQLILQASPIPPETTPTWAEFLWETEYINSVTPRHHEHPFIELYLPFLAVGQQRLPQHHLLTPTAYSNMEEALLERLVRVASPILQTRFAAFRASRQSSLEQLLGDKNAKTLYHAFIEAMQQGQWREFLLTYPVLARLMAIIVELWVASATEFIHRLAADWHEIGQTFHHEQELGAVCAVKPFCSDPHHGGRTVWAVTFSNGLHLFYKPRNLAPDQAYHDLINQFHMLGLEPQLKTINMLIRPDYGWVEAITPQPCPNQAALQRYYHRLGMVMALFYLLQGTDGHYENLIAYGEYPILIDIETILHPATSYTLLNTDLLPQKGQHNFSGLDGQPPATKMPVWSQVNCDGMSLMYEVRPVATTPNRPTLRGEPQPRQAYHTEIMEGFCLMYRFCQRHEAYLQQWLIHQRTMPTRYVGRVTEIYSTLIRQSLQAKALYDGARWAHIFSQLANYSPELQPVLAAEYQALYQLDIPYFMAIGHDLQSEYGAKITHYFTKSGQDDVSARLQQLSEADLAQQVTLLENTLA